MESTSNNKTTNNAEEPAYKVTSIVSALLKTDTSILHKALDGLNITTEEPHNHEGVKYKGINALFLRNAEIVNGFKSSEWASFEQWKKVNRSIKKGEKGTIIFYFSETFEDLGDDAKKVTVYGHAFLFNRAQLSPETDNAPKP